jgi:hypothetical protein
MIQLTDQEKMTIVSHSDLLQMFEHIGWYSSPKASFVKNSKLLIDEVQKALAEKNKKGEFK